MTQKTITSHHKIISLQNSPAASKHTQTLDKITKLKDLLPLLALEKIHDSSDEALQTIQKLEDLLQSKGHQEISRGSYIRKIAVALSVILDSIKFPENQTLQNKILQMLNKIENKYGKYLKHEILRRNLENWQNEANISTPQKEARAQASQRISETCLSESTILNLSNMKLTSIPSGTFQFLPNIEEIYLGGNLIDKIAPNTFNELPALTTLSLEANLITCIESYAFNSLPRLTELEFYSGFSNGNKINSIEPNAFNSLEGLVKLVLIGQTLESLDPNSFNEVPNITHLNLRGNKLTSLDLSKFPLLTELHLGRNKFTTIAENTFDGLTRLTTLNLEHNRITTIPENTFDGLTQLTTLNLGDNELTTIPEKTFDGLTLLTTLNLGNNELTTIPENTFDGLTRLTTLNLERNRITTIPENTFDGLTQLTTLNLKHNRLSSLTPGRLFGNLTSVRTIQLSNNRLNLATAAAITTFNTAEGPHRHIEFSINDRPVIGDSEITEASLPEMIRLWKGLDPSEEVKPLWSTLITQRPNQWQPFTTFLTRLHNECPRDNGEIDSQLKINIDTLLKQMEESFTGDLGQASPITFIQKCLNVATMSTGTCIDLVKVGYVLLQLESALFACTDEQTEQKAALKNRIDQINKTIDFVGNVTDGGILFDTELKKFIDIPPQPEDTELSLEKYRQHHFSEVNKSRAWIRIGDLVEDILKIVYELPDMSTQIHKIDMSYAGCCTIGKNTDYMKAALEYILAPSQTHE